MPIFENRGLPKLTADQAISQSKVDFIAPTQ